MTNVEERLARLQLEVAEVRLDIAGINRRIDRIDQGNPGRTTILSRSRTTAETRDGPQLFACSSGR
jgi:hypothetical protein